MFGTTLRGSASIAAIGVAFCVAFAGCLGDDSADTTAETPPPETTAAPELSAEAVVALDGLNASVDRLKLLAASLPDCGKEAQVRREWHRARRLVNQVSEATGITYRRNHNHPAADEFLSRAESVYETERSILPALAACRAQREREQAAQETRG
jgi:hypothetical protein